MWVRVDDPRLESTDEVRGETFKGGEPTEEYKVDLERLWRERDLVKSVDQVDHRHVGGYRIRIEEDPAGQLTIVNGRHRVQAAREAGVPAVLAEAVAYIDESEDATEDQKIVDNSDSGRVDVYENGLGQRADSTRHDHYFATFRADGVVYESGLVDREEERAEYLRWLGMIGTRGLT